MTIDFNDSHLLLTADGRLAEILWESIESVYVYKQDLEIVDRIATIIKIDGDLEVEINEEMDGWKPLVDALPEYLPNCRDFADWFMDVAFPAFDPKPTLIYRRLRVDQIM
ncbi:MAG: hypothetical protein IPM21_05770 [Acidobacteria bacterium]|nr:hypothetical protein [Acidobacteriota bacterium]